MNMGSLLRIRRKVMVNILYSAQMGKLEQVTFLHYAIMRLLFWDVKGHIVEYITHWFHFR